MAFARRSGGSELLLFWKENVVLVEPPDHLIVIIEKLSGREDHCTQHVSTIGVPLDCPASCATCIRSEWGAGFRQV